MGTFLLWLGAHEEITSLVRLSARGLGTRTVGNLHGQKEPLAGRRGHQNI